MKNIFIILLLFFYITTCLAVVGSVPDKPLFDLNAAEDQFNEIEMKVKDAKISIDFLSFHQGSLEKSIANSQACISRQQKAFIKIEETLNIVTLNHTQKGIAKTTIQNYLDERAQSIRERLAACSYFNYKAKDLLVNLRNILQTKIKEAMWHESNEFKVALVNPLHSLKDIHWVYSKPINPFLMVGVYIFVYLVGAFVIYHIFHYRVTRLFIRQLKLDLESICYTAYTVLFFGAVSCFLTHQIEVQFISPESMILAKWTIELFFYCFIMAFSYYFFSRQRLDLMKKVKKVFLSLLILFFVIFIITSTLCYAYLAIYLGDGLLKTLVMTVIVTTLMVLAPRISAILYRYLSTRLRKKRYRLVKKVQPEIEFLLLRYSLQAILLFTWLFVFNYIWLISSGFTSDILDWITSGFIILSIKIVPLLIFQACLVFSLLCISVRAMLCYLSFKFNPILFNFWYLIAIIISLYIAGVNLTSITVIAGALSVGIGMGLRGVVNNFVSGLILFVEKPFQRGDRIIVGGTEGFVKNIGLRSTQIRTIDRMDVILPNEKLVHGEVSNYMLNNNCSPQKFTIDVAYDSDIDKATSILLETATSNHKIMNAFRFAPVVKVVSVTSKAITLQLSYTIKNPKDIFTIDSELNINVLSKFKENEIAVA